MRVRPLWFANRDDFPRIVSIDRRRDERAIIGQETVVERLLIAFLADGQVLMEDLPGPIFGNLVLADEIHRAPAKVQAALLEAMEEGDVTVAGTAAAPPTKIPQDLIFAACQEVHAIHVAEVAERYIVDLVIGTREPQHHGGDLAKWIRLGAGSGPRPAARPGLRLAGQYPRRRPGLPRPPHPSFLRGGSRREDAE